MGFTYKKLGFILIIVIALIIIFWGFDFFSTKTSTNKNIEVSGDLIIFHAGSLSVPFKEITDSFKIKYPDVNILTEAAGSKTCARKISDLNKRCDVFASADINVIENMLVPQWADTAFAFARNSMAIVFTDKSKHHEIINADNWYNILSKPEIKTGRSDPFSDPCGVRAVLTVKLAENYYKSPNLTEKLLSKDSKYMRPKETDLLALLETGTIDYIYLYKSVAIQHNLKYIELPDEINLGNDSFNTNYSDVYAEITDSKTGNKIKEYGSVMVYGITIPKSCQNINAAKTFLNYVLSEKGQEIMKRNGQ